MTQSELKEILESHKAWLNRIEGGKRADLQKADLSEADLMDVDLRGADLSGADLRRTKLRRADLRGAFLWEANLQRADLWRANLQEADLWKADLSKADLSKADLQGASLLRAKLIETDLQGVDLRGADLQAADLRGARLNEANIETATLNELIPICCPEVGSFVGWKKAQNNKIVKLQITEDAKRSSATTRKCRCNKALVLAIENIDGTDSELKEVVSNYDSSFIYRIGETVEVKDFYEDRKNECAAGIHFFITRQEAVNY